MLKVMFSDTGLFNSPSAAMDKATMTMAAVSVRNTRGPSVTGIALFVRARATSSEENPPSGPTNNDTGQDACANASSAGRSARTEGKSFRPGASANACSNVMGGRSGGNFPRPLCSAASRMILRQRSHRPAPGERRHVRWVRMG